MPRNLAAERREIILSLFDHGGLGLEVGPGYDAFFPKSQGFNVQTVDHADGEALRRKYSDFADKIEEVDYVSDGGSLLELIGEPKKYDFIFASHVIEHITDVVRFIGDCESLLKDNGTLVLVVPDKRFCFDTFRPISTVGQVLDAHIEKRTRHTPGQIFDFYLSCAQRSGSGIWVEPNLSDMSLMNEFSVVETKFREATSTSDYMDTHGWMFTPTSFRLLIKKLRQMGYIASGDDVVFTNHDNPVYRFEFYVTLKKCARENQENDLELLSSIRSELQEVTVECTPVPLYGCHIAKVVETYDSNQDETMGAENFLQNLDTSIFTIPSSTTPGDKTSLLRLQKLVSGTVENFVYLEIGSDRGGSLAPILADGNCASLLSIDLRPDFQPDERGAKFPYPTDGEQAMMNNLRAQFSEAQLKRIRTFRADIRDVDATALPKVDLALIDGEHTDVACFSDANRILDFVKPDAIIAFHDANLVADAIQNFEKMLARLGITFTTVLLPDVVGAIGMGKFADLLRSELDELSFERQSYFATSQLQRWVAVGQAMQEQGRISTPDEAAERRTAELAKENDTLRQDLAASRAVINSLREELSAARSHVHKLLGSTSWKVSAPLRYFVKILRR
ncbi:methyltransferase domain-containing protein [Endobacterium cereale]|uniref:methyltransferase domain-containing protein n=1 Tax=Endobacterium cereale TaxID=2663029 RepID=UPI002B477658|nr:methyltransferase domain-containing protein [Endobacterium cereale]MEB2848291.1 methyltransferase domain-containing protein [Endobacterium cereale]